MSKNLERRVNRKLAGCAVRCEADSARNGRNRRALRSDAPSRTVSPPSRGAAVAKLPGVEVVFYKEILDHRGFPHRCEVMRVCCDGAQDAAAVCGAIHRFERLQRVTLWKVAADGYEVVSKRAAR
ncbi:hypothetical protein LJ655_01215 [Paraburkholderia sp. MMS20-SJTN17]|uniref:Uncharacterized protein n=1 Tax=Paraburkholderia translucens TaxID=2886945 RepID=A0ABS8K728_9BURK|nr:hypothetical protein [Paraburkholderia sp. MMS20-SJTN17]MCC8400524.1 hypothetical protein [Paraburkholderia sp. MMS20-SJTN17]